MTMFRAAPRAVSHSGQQRFLNKAAACVRPLTFVCFASGAILGAALTAAYFSDAQFAQFTRDPAAVMNASPFVGVISNLGTWVWSAAVTTCLMTAMILRGDGTHRAWTRFFFTSAAFSLLLLIDDGLMVHDRLLEETWHISERVIYPVYFAIAGAWLWINRVPVLRSNYVLLLIALMFFGVAILGDSMDLFEHDVLHYMVEDGAKFVGILIWFTYFLLTARTLLAPRQQATV